MSVCEVRESWLLARQQGLGGSDIAAVVGLSPFKRPIDIFVGKTEAIEFGEDVREFMRWGNLLEPVIRAEYAARSQQEVVFGLDIAPFFPGRSAEWDGQTIVHAEDRNWMLGTPDGIHRNSDSGLEIKNSGFKGEGWGTPGTDEIPDHYMIQCQWYMAVTGRPRWDVAVLFSGNRLETFHLERNDDLISELVSTGEWFWNDRVLKRIPPPVDYTESYARYLGRKYSLASGDVLPATEEIAFMAMDLEATQATRKECEEREQLLKNQLGELLGGFQKSRGDFGSVNWIRPKQGTRIDWESVAKALGPSNELIAEHTKPVKNTPFIRLFSKKEK
jgi:putative phage-type endonuclease